MEKPAKITFFCSNCITRDSISVKDCPECQNHRIIAAYAPVETLTSGFCKPNLRYGVDNGLYHILLLTNVEATGGLSENFISQYELVQDTRYIKDRFFFTKPLDSIFLSHIHPFITQVAWIYKQ
jgi:hypothetical protein